MDARSFDALTRTLGIGLPRRRTIALLAGAVSPLLAHGSAGAGCKKVGRKCDKNKACCDGAKCKGGKNGKCKCKNGFTKCDKRCYDLNKDRQNCGACGNACIPPDACCDGECNLTCVL